MSSLIEEAFPSLVPALLALPPPEGKTLAYGTAGFRDKADLLESTFMRMGVLAALRSYAREGQVIGLMVTASHNPVEDNGVKIVDPEGGMLAMSWEKDAALLANAHEKETLIAAFQEILSAEPPLLTALEKKKEEGGGRVSVRVWVGRDTRPHSATLSSLAIEGALLLGAEVLDLGVLTTPQLHHCVRMENGIGASASFHVPGGIEEWKGEDGYVSLLTSAYLGLLSTQEDASKGLTSPSLYIDCAHGVGAVKFPAVVSSINAASASADTLLDTSLINTPEEDPSSSFLNEGCGAEYVQKGQLPPKGMSQEGNRGNRWASFDGDADRLVYHFYDEEGTWHLLDGDKMATLAADFLMSELKESALPPPEGDPGWKVAVVQTAYANGASTRYLRSKDAPVTFAKTGVKFVHHEAEKYDLGIYFEANGHGTVLFSERLALSLLMHVETTQDPQQKRATERLLFSQQLINQAVGDAMSDLLFIEAVLRLKGWNVSDWFSLLYTDLPSKQSKLCVKDRTVLKCNDDETRTLVPAGLQEKLDTLMSTVTQGRAFVRPSGTEDVVRIYAEATTQKEADKLASLVAVAVYDLAGGVGERPSTA